MGSIPVAAAATSFAGVEGAPKHEKLIGIQIGAVSFLDEGVDQVLDIIQERGNVNAIFLATFTYGRGIGGRQVPGQPLPVGRDWQADLLAQERDGHPGGVR